LEDEPIYIPDSLHKVAKVVYYDYDEYPDLLIIPPVLANQNQKSLKVIKNRVREAQEQKRKQQINPENAGVEVIIPEWVMEDVISMERNIKVIDVISHDLDRDGHDDIILALKDNDRYSLIQLFLEDPDHNKFKRLDLQFENEGIKQLLDVVEIDNSGWEVIIYLTVYDKLASIVNHDPLYKSEYILPDKLQVPYTLHKFYSLDIDEDGLIDFLFPIRNRLVLVTRENGRTWIEKTIAHGKLMDISMSRTLTPSHFDIILLWKDSVSLLTQTLITNDNSNEFFLYAWSTPRGRVYGYKERSINLSDGHDWTSCSMEDLKQDGSIDLLLYSEEESIIYWGRKIVATVLDFGWDPNFWIYLMYYVIVLSLVVGLVHAYFAGKAEIIDIKQFKTNATRMDQPNGIYKGRQYRKTTV
jgi:hypothetical protein